MIEKVKLFFSFLWFGRTYRLYKLKTRYPQLYTFLYEEGEKHE